MSKYSNWRSEDRASSGRSAQRSAPHLVEKRVRGSGANGQLYGAACTVEAGDRLGEQAIGDAGAGPDAEHAILTAAPTLCFGFEVLRLLQQRACARQQGFSHAGQHQLAPGAFKQCAAQIRFQLGERLGRCRLADMQPFGGGGQRAGVSRGDKEAGRPKA